MEKTPSTVVKKNSIRSKPEKKVFLITISSKLYEFTISKQKDKINFLFEQNDSLLKTVYEDEYTVDFFKSKSRYFKLFENIDELYNNLIGIFDEKNYEIINDNNILSVKLTPMVHLDNSEINLIIPLKSIESKELIQQLFDENLALGTRVEELEKEIRSLRSDYKNMSHMVENLRQVIKKLEEEKK
jgi:hypothetical protein